MCIIFAYFEGGKLKRRKQERRKERREERMKEERKELRERKEGMQTGKKD
jgi:hypothetical protein